MENISPSNLNASPLILLTGCINPDGMAYTKLQNPDIRKAQYIEAIKFYLHKTTNKILFIENSNTDISFEFENEVGKNRLEFIVFAGNDYDKKLGKGYGEMQILKYAFNHSKFVKEASTICKITGRYKILNINQLLKHYGRCQCDFMVDLLNQLKYSDSRIFMAKKLFFEDYLFKLENEVNDSKGYYFEHALRNSVLFAVMDNLTYLPFKYLPRIIGTSGTDDLNYNHSFLKWFKKYLKKKDNFKYFITPPDNY
ncbi:MAG: hypothetical protein EOP00_14030 [Pedobacter sp.]|nr:MAG: hypothetical protein EOP00_14030 [Pedobacter sp.]